MMTNQNNPATKLYAGIEAGGTKFNCVVGTDPLNIIARGKIPTTTPEETLDMTRDFFAQQISEHGEFEALGIACFGPCDLHKESPTYGYITKTPKKHWSDTDVVGYFKKELGLPIGFDTDTNGAALGEHLYGAGQGIDDFVYVTIGTGIGAGVFANGMPVNGLLHTELGHMIVARDKQRDPFEGFCPFHSDCLSALACGPAIEARWKCSGHDLPEDHEAWDLEAHYLAIMCLNIAMCYSPTRIILGGGVMGQEHLYPKVRKEFATLMNGYMMPPIALEEYIVAPGLPGQSGEAGALALALQANR